MIKLTGNDCDWRILQSVVWASWPASLYTWHPPKHKVEMTWKTCMTCITCMTCMTCMICMSCKVVPDIFLNKKYLNDFQNNNIINSFDKIINRITRFYGSSCLKSRKLVVSDFLYWSISLILDPTIFVLCCSFNRLEPFFFNSKSIICK